MLHSNRAKAGENVAFVMKEVHEGAVCSRFFFLLACTISWRRSRAEPMMGNGTCILYHLVSTVFSQHLDAEICANGHIFAQERDVLQRWGSGCCRCKRRRRTHSSAFISLASWVETRAVSVLQADLVVYVQIFVDVMQML